MRPAAATAIVLSITAVFFVVTGAAGDERVAKYSEQILPATMELRGSNTFVKAFRHGDRPAPGTLPIRTQLLEENTFAVYTTSEIDKQIMDIKRGVVANLDDAINRLRAEREKTNQKLKEDLLSAIERAVGQQLSHEQVGRIQALVAKEVAVQLQAAMSGELKDQLRKELLVELQRMR